MRAVLKKVATKYKHEHLATEEPKVEKEKIIIVCQPVHHSNLTHMILPRPMLKKLYKKDELY